VNFRGSCRWGMLVIGVEGEGYVFNLPLDASPA
jgi:hypothetical protein